MFLKLMEDTTNDLFKIRGYLYVNDIYETLGVEWNPEWENSCRIWNDNPVEFNIMQSCDDNGFILDIDL